MEPGKTISPGSNRMPKTEIYEVHNNRCWNLKHVFLTSILVHFWVLCFPSSAIEGGQDPRKGRKGSIPPFHLLLHRSCACPVFLYRSLLALLSFAYMYEYQVGDLDKVLQDHIRKYHYVFLNVYEHLLTFNNTYKIVQVGSLTQLDVSSICLLAKAAGSEDLASFLGSQPPKPPQPPQPPSMAGGGNIGMSDGAEPPDSIPIFCMRVISNCCCLGTCSDSKEDEKSIRIWAQEKTSEKTQLSWNQESSKMI